MLTYTCYVLASSTSNGDEQRSLDSGSGRVDGRRSAVRRRTRSARDVARHVPLSSRRRQSNPSVECHVDGREAGTRGRRAASGSPRGRRRGSVDPTRVVSTRSVNAVHLSTQRSTSSEHLRRVALAVRQLHDIGKRMSLARYSSTVNTRLSTIICLTRQTAAFLAERYNVTFGLWHKPPVCNVVEP